MQYPSGQIALCKVRSSRSMSRAIREEMCDLVRTRYTVFCIFQ